MAHRNLVTVVFEKRREQIVVYMIIEENGTK